MRLKNLSLQWRLTLMTATAMAIACFAVTVLISCSANLKMDEIGAVFVEEDGTTSPVNLDEVEIIPEYYQWVADRKQRFNVQSGVTMVGIILISSLFTYFITGKGLRRLNQLSEEIEQVQAQNLAKPLQVQDIPQELKRLSQSFNQMLARLDESFAGEKQFSANAAHELRTPLAIMQTKIEVFQKTEPHSTEEYQNELGEIKVQIERLSKLINELLEMTGIQSAPRTDIVSLKDLVEEVFCDLEDLAEKKGVRLTETSSEGELRGNETLIYRAIFNLVENAIKYNHPSGEVTVSIENGADTIELIVANTGSEIPIEYQEKVFDPFFRIDRSRSRELGGAGIGLAMVRAIAELHEGRVYIKSSTAEQTQIALILKRNGYVKETIS